MSGLRGETPAEEGQISVDIESQAEGEDAPDWLEGISDEGLVIWAFNSVTKELYGERVVKWETVPDMIKHDFTESVPIGEEQPGDVYCMFGGENGAAYTGFRNFFSSASYRFWITVDSDKSFHNMERL